MCGPSGRISSAGTSGRSSWLGGSFFVPKLGPYVMCGPSCKEGKVG